LALAPGVLVGRSMQKLITLCAGLALAAGCKKTHYSPNCSRDVDLVAPWTELGIPLGDDIRVCAANDLKVDLEYLVGDKATWEAKYEETLVGKGYAKERCSSLACTFTKGSEHISVQVNQVAAGTKAKTIVHLTRTK
jgi:hypothetical protein